MITHAQHNLIHVATQFISSVERLAAMQNNRSLSVHKYKVTRVKTAVVGEHELLGWLRNAIQVCHTYRGVVEILSN